MVQPKGQDNGGNPPLFDVGCLGRIGDVEAMDDGRYNIILEGLQRFAIIKRTGSHHRRSGRSKPSCGKKTRPATRCRLPSAPSLEIESRRFADAQGYAVDWKAVGQLDDYSLVNAIAQIAPFDYAAKQALLEARGLSMRADLIVQLMQFFGRHDGSEDRVTLSNQKNWRAGRRSRIALQAPQVARPTTA